jgi:hypothetical protein
MGSIGAAQCGVDGTGGTGVWGRLGGGTSGPREDGGAGGISSGLGAGTGDGGNGVAGGAGTGEGGKGCGCSGAWAIVVSARSPMPTTAHMKRTTENSLLISSRT